MKPIAGGERADEHLNIYFKKMIISIDEKRRTQKGTVEQEGRQNNMHYSFETGPVLNRSAWSGFKTMTCAGPVSKP